MSTVDVQTITPTQAKELMQLNTHNRQIRPRHVKFLAEEIRSGRWKLTNDAVAISKTEVLLNGQHRLLAIIEADQAADLLVLRGADLDSQVVTDTGNRRNLADALYLAGFENLSCMAATVTFIFRLTDQTVTFPASRAKKYPYQPQIDFAIKNETMLTEALHVARRVRERVRFPGSMISGLWFVQSEIDQADADAFWESIASGVGLAEEDARLAWRRWVERQNVGGRNVVTPEAVKVAMTIKAWNYWRSGTPVRLLTWKPGGSNPEGFPTIQ